MKTEILEQLFLELSQVLNERPEKTERELDLEMEVTRLQELLTKSSTKLILTKVAGEIVVERAWQIDEGLTSRQEDALEDGELSGAAGFYAMYAFNKKGSWAPEQWPWGIKDWETKPVRKILITAAALIIAEIERMDRKKCAHKNLTTLSDRDICRDCGRVLWL